LAVVAAAEAEALKAELEEAVAAGTDILQVELAVLEL
jgi:hypothetical protein